MIGMPPVEHAAPIKDYIAFYLDECAPENDPIFHCLGLVPNTEAWIEWRSIDITDDKVHEIMRIAEEHDLVDFLNGWGDISMPSARQQYQDFCAELNP